MKFKKFLSVFLAFALLFSISACSKKPPVDNRECKISFNSSFVSVYEGASTPLDINFTLDGENADLSLLTFTYDSSVIKIENGTIYGLKAGGTNLYASYNGVESYTFIFVNENSCTISLSQTAVGLIKGHNNYSTATLSATATENNVEVNNPQITWTVEDPNVATVNGGVVTAVNTGTTTLTAKYNGATATAEIFVTDEITKAQVNSFAEDYVNIFGRTYKSSGDSLAMDHVTTGIELAFCGSYLKANLTVNKEIYINIYVDGTLTAKRTKLTPTTETYYLAQNLSSTIHKVRIVKSSELFDGQIKLKSFDAISFARIPEKSNFKIEFIGDSITAGYGALASNGMARSIENSDGASSYAYQTALNLNADYSVVAVEGICAKVNHWRSDWTMYDLYTRVSGIRTTDYAFDFNPNVVVINLGTNESSYVSEAYTPSYKNQYRADLKSFISLVREKNPNAYIIYAYGMMETDYFIETEIKGAISELKDSKIVYKNFKADTNGASMHPYKVAQKDWGVELAQFIENLVK